MFQTTSQLCIYIYVLIHMLMEAQPNRMGSVLLKNAMPCRTEICDSSLEPQSIQIEMERLEKNSSARALEISIIPSPNIN
jgi:hypothetical protein